MTTGTNFPLGDAWPCEAFIQAAVAKWLDAQGFVCRPNPPIDLDARRSATGERWVVEAKGETKATGTDFQTCLGQVLQRMDDRAASYAIAVPHTDRCLRLCRSVPDHVREALGLHWLLVSAGGEVRLVAPAETV